MPQNIGELSGYSIVSGEWSPSVAKKNRKHSNIQHNTAHTGGYLTDRATQLSTGK